MTIELKKSGERFHTQIPWLDSRHSFSFGGHYHPDNTHHGLLLVSNDDVIRAGTGFRTHPHQDMEIITWVLSGSVEHKDSEGHSGVIYPGLAQRMSAGTGIWHSEMSGKEDTRLVQMWVVPDMPGVKPGYEQLDINKELSKGGLVPVASGRSKHTAIKIRQQGATLWAARLGPGEAAAVPDAPYVHLYVARGTAALEEAGTLEEGDAARLTAAGGRRLAAGPGGAEVLLWEMDSVLT